MRLLKLIVVAPLVVMLVAPSGAFGQTRHIVDPSELAAAVAQQSATEDAQRRTVRGVLARPEAADVMARLGIDRARVMSAVDLLSGAELQRAADAAAPVADDSIVGGQNGVWISTTLIIAILVIVIIVVAVAD